MYIYLRFIFKIHHIPSFFLNILQKEYKLKYFFQQNKIYGYKFTYYLHVN